MMPSLLPRLVACLGALLAAGCHSGPDLPRVLTIQTGERTVVMLRQKAGKLELTLQNETAGYAKDVYRDDSPDKALKVVPDAELQLLLDVFAEQGMFAAQPPPGPDALDVLVVAQAGRTWSWARRQRGMQASEMPFLQAKQYFLNVYNGNTAYHGTGDQKPDFRNERLRAQDEAAAASRRLRDLPRQP